MFDPSNPTTSAHEIWARQNAATQHFIEEYVEFPKRQRTESGRVGIIRLVRDIPEVLLFLGLYIKKSWFRVNFPQNYLNQPPSFRILSSFASEDAETLIEKVTAVRDPKIMSQQSTLQMLIQEIKHTLDEQQYVDGNRQAFIAG